MAIDPADLVDAAKSCYDEEVGRRGLVRDSPVFEEPIQSDSPSPANGIQKAALVACVLTIGGLVIPTWTAVHQPYEMTQERPWVVPFVLALAILSALSPLFYFALYRDRGDLGLSRNLRRASLGAAAYLALLIAFHAAGWIESFKPPSVLSQYRDTWTMGDTASLLDICANAGTIVLLIAFFRQGESSLSGRPISSELLFITRISLLVAFVATNGEIVRLVLPQSWSAPYSVLASFRTVFGQARWCVAPIIVFLAAPRFPLHAGSQAAE
jgi:hypothetical protein